MAAKPKTPKPNAKPSRTPKPAAGTTTTGSGKKPRQKPAAAGTTTTGGKKPRQKLGWWIKLTLSQRRKYLKENPGSDLKDKLRWKLPTGDKPGVKPGDKPGTKPGTKPDSKDKAARLKARLAERLKKHSEKIASVRETIKKAATIRKQREALAVYNAKGRANAAVKTLMNKTKARLAYLKATTPEIKDGKIFTPKAERYRYDVVKFTPKKVKGVNTKKTNKKRPASAEQKASAKKAGKEKKQRGNRSRKATV